MIVNLVSGGIDSTVMQYMYPGHTPVFVDYGQPYAAAEEATCRGLFDKRLVKIVAKRKERLSNNIFVPARNLMLAAVVTAQLAPDEIWMAGLRDDKVVDKTPEAFARMSEVISSVAGKQVKVHSPFWSLSKGEIVEAYLAEGHDAEVLRRQTFSCYRRVHFGTNCLDCPACFRKFVALVTNGIEMQPLCRRICDEYLGKLHLYDKDRQARIIIAMKCIYARIIAVDLDGVLAEPDRMALSEIRNIKQSMVKRKVIDTGKQRVNAQYRNGAAILIFTSRLESDRDITKAWLLSNGIEHHGLIMGKPRYDLFVDDNAISGFAK